MADIPVLWWVTAVSEIVAVVLVFRIWRSGEFVVLKILLSLVALIPLLGPLVVLWVGGFPSRAPETMQDRGSRGDYYLNWATVISANSSIRRFAKWRAKVSASDDPAP